MSLGLIPVGENRWTVLKIPARRIKNKVRINNEKISKKISKKNIEKKYKFCIILHISVKKNYILQLAYHNEGVLNECLNYLISD